jgi:hypothetical protein
MLCAAMNSQSAADTSPPGIVGTTLASWQRTESTSARGNARRSDATFSMDIVPVIESVVMCTALRRYSVPSDQTCARLSSTG